MPANSRLLIYTDGLTDAFPQGGEASAAYGVRGIREALKAVRAGTTEAALDALFRSSHDYTGGTGRHDDTSAVVVDRS